MKVKHKKTSLQNDSSDANLVNPSDWNDDHKVVEDLGALTIASDGSLVIDWAMGDFRTLVMSRNVTSVTFANAPPTNEARSLVIRIVQDATGGRTFALPVVMKAMGSTDTAIQSPANAYTILTLLTFDQGARVEYAMCAGGA